MIAHMGRTFQAALDPTWLTGPIFDKELRVSSRRRRSYTLRFFYVLVLTVFVAIVWLSVVEMQGNATVQQSRMAVAGKEIIAKIVIFQFIAMQILAVIMLSNAISDEVYHRTLGLLMTTPINSLQIVMGKVLSRLLQLVLLLAITLPVLAIVRVFGGVSWVYLLSSFSITLTAAIFAGSISLLLSIENRHSYAVMVRAMFILISFYFILPLLAGVLWGRTIGLPGTSQSSQISPLVVILLHINPVAGLTLTTAQMRSPTGQILPYSWPLQCVALLGLSALILAWSMAVVRKVALRQATGQIPEHGAKRAKRRALGAAMDRKAATRPARRRTVQEIRRVQGPPVVWKELRAPFIQGVDNRNSHIGLAVTIGALLLTYLASAQSRCLDEGFTHASYVMLFIFIGTIVNTVFATTRITTEKESQSWLLLLATPLSDAEILFGKAVSAFRRCLPIWGLLAGHMVLFILVGYIHAIAVLHLLLLVAWITVFITGAGLYFGARFARTTSAVVAGFALILGLWAAGPILAGLFSFTGKGAELSKLYMWTHPAVQTELIMAGAAGPENARLPLRSLEYGEADIVYHPGGRTLHAGSTTLMLAMVAGIYILAGLLFFWRARCRLRRNVFVQASV